MRPLYSLIKNQFGIGSTIYYSHLPEYFSKYVDQLNLHQLKMLLKKTNTTTIQTTEVILKIPNFKKIFDFVGENGLKLLIEVNLKSLTKFDFIKLQALKDYDFELIIFLDGSEDFFSVRRINKLRQLGQSHLMFYGQQSKLIKKLFYKLIGIRYASISYHCDLHFIFLFGPSRWLEKQSYFKKIFDKKNKAHPKFATINLERWDYVDEFSLKPIYENQTNGFKKLSVIIPVYNHKKELYSTLDSLKKQTLSTSEFELIIVDDGSTDSLNDEINQHLKRNFSKVQYKYIYFPRTKPRVIGDNNYRTGRARNIGVYHSKANVLLFIDCGIIIQNNHLEELLELHKKFDVIQPLRWHLLEGVEPNKYWASKNKKLTYSRSDNYWEDFQISKTDWHTQPNGWKYFSTFCLSVKRQAFLQAGKFNPNFIYYGFEDVDLGLRLNYMGQRFYKWHKDVLHLFQPNTRTETSNSLNGFKKSAKLLFALYPKEYIYNELKSYYD